ncbi:unnamed protein product [Ectocarpus fasciculatus]
MKSGSKIHSLQVTTHEERIANSDRLSGRQQDTLENGTARDAGLPRARGGNTTRDLAAAAPVQHVDLDPDELTVEVPGLRVHAPWPGLHGACEGCGAPSVSGLGSGPTECEHCHRQIPGGEGGFRGKSKAPAAAAVGGVKAGKAGVVAVTSSRKVALSDERAKALAWAGGAMLTTSSLLLLLLLVTWRGIPFSLFSALSPWLAIYLPIPLGFLNGGWSVHCAKSGHIRHHSTGSCASRGGMCGTAWGCSGPSCALNLGLDLGLLITAVLAALPAGASARGCDYDCFWLLCFPCAPGGGDGMASVLVLTALGLAFAAGFKMWIMAPALLSGLNGEQDFLPW